MGAWGRPLYESDSILNKSGQMWQARKAGQGGWPSWSPACVHGQGKGEKAGSLRVSAEPYKVASTGSSARHRPDGR